MAESGKTAGKNVLDDTDLSDDPIISAIQSLRASVDDLQHNDNDMGMDALKAAITANTNRGSGTDGTDGSDGAKGAAGATGSAGAKGDKGDTGAAGNNGSNGSNGNNGKAGSNGTNGTNGVLAITEGYTAQLAVTSSRGIYTLAISVDHDDFDSPKTVALTIK